MPTYSNTYFNSYMVRLEVDELKPVKATIYISIPIWFDWKVPTVDPNVSEP